MLTYIGKRNFYIATVKPNDIPIRVSDSVIIISYVNNLYYQMIINYTQVQSRQKYKMVFDYVTCQKPNL